MANRYWVGGTGNWSDNTNHWSASSGGSPGAGLPTSSDDVFIDSNSGFGSGGTLTLDIEGSCYNFICTSGHTFTLNGSNLLNVFGSIELESGMTCEIEFDFQGSGSGKTITSNGCTFYLCFFYNSTTGWTIQDDFSCLYFYIENGTFDANNHNITASNFVFSAGQFGRDPIVNMGTGIWTISSYDDYPYNFAWDVIIDGGGTFTVNQSSSTIKFTDSSSNLKTFNGGDKTYNNLWFSGTGTGNFVIKGNNTFNELKIDNPPHTILIDASSTQIVSSFIAIGTSGSLITLNRNGGSGSNQFTLSKSSGIVECDYLDISNSNAIGGATWYAGSHSVDTTNNDGWLFEDAPEPTSIMSLNKGYW